MRKFAAKLIFVGFGLLMSVSGCRKDDPAKPEEEPENQISALTFRLTNIPRNAIIKTGSFGDTQIKVEGIACDSLNQVTGITINNNPVTIINLKDCQSFSTDINSVWGLNIIDGIAKNNLGDELSLVQSYIRSPEYSLASEGKKGVSMIPDAWIMHIGQEVLDDGDRSDFDDLASVIERLVNSYSFDEILPNVIYDGIVSTKHDCIWPLNDQTNRNGSKVEKNGIFNLGSITIDSVYGITSSYDLIRLKFKISNTTLPFKAQGYSDLYCIPPYEIGASTNGTYSFENAEVSVAYKVHPSVVDGRLLDGKIAVDPFYNLVNINGSFIHFDLTGISVIDDIFSWFVNLWLNSFYESITESIKHQLDENLPPVLEDFLNNFNLEPTIIIPAPVNIQLNVSSELSSINFGLGGNGNMNIGLAARVEPSVFKKDITNHGSIIGTSKSPFYNMSENLGIGIKNDFINQVLWAIWAGGGFDIKDGNTDLINNLAGSAGLNANILSVETSLPPVLMPGENDSELKIGFGDVLVKSKINPELIGLTNVKNNPIEISTYVSILITIKFELDPVTHTMNFVQIEGPEIHVQFVDQILTDKTIALTNKMGTITSDCLKQFFSEAIGAIKLPSLSLGDIGEVQTAIKWVIDNGAIDYSSGYHLLVGDTGGEKQ